MKEETITIYHPQSWFEKFLGSIPKVDRTIPGRIIYTDCIIQSDTELRICSKFTHIFDDETYHGIIPLVKIAGDYRYLCAVDYVSKNV